MYTNIGEKIKGLAKATAWIGIALSIVSGVAIISNGSNASPYYGASGITAITGILTIVIGSLVSWLGSWVLYGFGELIERVQSIDSKTPATDANAAARASAKPAGTQKTTFAWTCATCKAENPDGKLFCHNCGAIKR